MLAKKKQLEDRLRRKTEQRQRSADLAAESGVSGRVAVAEEEELIAQNDLDRLSTVGKLMKAMIYHLFLHSILCHCTYSYSFGVMLLSVALIVF